MLCLLIVEPNHRMCSHMFSGVSNYQFVIPMREFLLAYFRLENVLDNAPLQEMTGANFHPCLSLTNSIHPHIDIVIIGFYLKLC